MAGQTLAVFVGWAGNIDWSQKMCLRNVLNENELMLHSGINDPSPLSNNMTTKHCML